MLSYLRTYPAMVGAVLLGLVLSMYLYAHELVVRTMHTARSAPLGEACTDPSIQSPQQNPNKMLFISCGGFLE